MAEGVQSLLLYVCTLKHTVESFSEVQQSGVTLVKTAFIVSIGFYLLICLYIKHKLNLLLVYTFVR